MIKQEAHVFSGLHRDNHPIKQDGKYLWDALNIRLTNREGNSLLSVTNERGTLDTGVTLKGEYIGHCIIGKYIVVFTLSITNNISNIYRIEKTGDGYTKQDYKKLVLYSGQLNLSKDNPIDTLGVIENDLLQKVYWIDGRNQPRVIIITKPELKMSKDNIEYYYNKEKAISIGQDLLYKENDFNFVQNLKLQEKITVEKIYGTGVFTPGTIQYVFTYFNKYAQETHIFYTTELYYISNIDRGGSPDKTLANSFKITIGNPDTDFEYIRVYSIHRSSLDATPSVRQLPDMRISDKMFIIDNGTTGTDVDPTQLLYLGGKKFIPQTFTAKDGTLFFGNITTQQGDFTVKNYLKNVLSDETQKDITLEEITTSRTFTKPAVTYYYSDDSLSANTNYNAGFKYDEYYRLGLQAQLEDGSWTQPVWVKDDVLAEKYPIIEDVEGDSYTKKLSQYSKELVISDTVLQNLKEKGVKKLRTCVVFPNSYERKVVCQGVLNPTVYNCSYRASNAPYAQASWFFRPAKMDYSKQTQYKYGGNIEFKHNYALTTDSFNHEIQSMEVTSNKTVSEAKDDGTCNQNFYIDENIVTLNSPDIELDSYLYNADLSKLKLRIIGYVELSAIYGDASITTSSPTINPDAAGIVISQIGYDSSVASYNKNNGGLVSQTMYSDSYVTVNGKNEYKYSDNITSFKTCTFHRDGSLNNDSRRAGDDSGTRSAVLKTKVIANLKFFDTFKPIKGFDTGKKDKENNPIYTSYIDITDPKLFSDNEVNIVKLEGIRNIYDASTGKFTKTESIYYNYEGNADQLITSKQEYNVAFDNGDNIATTTDPIRMKYKSTPHIVFRFKDTKNEDENNIVLLPRNVNFPTAGTEINMPNWLMQKSPESGMTDSDIIESDGNYMGEITHFGIIFSEEKADEITQYANNKNVYCQYTDKDKKTEIMVANIEFDEQKKNHIPKNVIPDSQNRVFKILKSTPIYTTGDESNGFISIKTIDDWGVGYEYSDKQLSIIHLLKDIYVEISHKGTIEKTSYNASDFKDTTTNTSEDSTSAKDSTPITYQYYTFGDELTEEQLGDKNLFPRPYLLIAELVNDNIDNSVRFGGNSDSALESNLWYPASLPVSIENTTTENDSTVLHVPYSFGDTWYTRYDCLKTYPFTQEDTNQVVEIGSFLCETRVNLGGRYDINKGKLSNIYTTNTNFNQINSVYNQKDNYFTYRILNDKIFDINNYSSQIAWSLQKNSGDSTDAWTNITLANTLDLDSKNGDVTSLQVWNEYLLAFQEKSLSKINFNSRVEIPTSDGIPIEISNSYKVDGTTVISSNIGCTNKYTISNSSQGIYFIDNQTSSIYLFNGQLANLSTSLGIQQWTKSSFINNKWSLNPIINNGIRTFYDNSYGDVYFTPGLSNVENNALCFSEKLNQFTSFYSYGGVQAMFNYNNDFYSLLNDTDITKIYVNNKGNYNSFYDKYKDWYISFISNDNPTFTKVFDNIELRADIYNENNSLLNICPVNFIEASNEYQQSLPKESYDFKKKFRIWRGLIPRAENRNRIVNPWAKITIGRKNNIKNITEKEQKYKVIIHDIVMKYTI